MATKEHALKDVESQLELDRDGDHQSTSVGEGPTFVHKLIGGSLGGRSFGKRGPLDHIQAALVSSIFQASIQLAFSTSPAPC